MQSLFDSLINVPSIPTEELIYDWIDHNWYRWFMLSRRVPGTRFYDAWPQLSINHRYHVAEGVARYAKLLAAFTSEYVETVTGQGPEGRFRLALRDDLPDWKPRIEPRASREEFQDITERKWGKRNIVCPGPGGPYVLQHRDLIPSTIFVTIPEDDEEKAEATAIIDRQSLAYSRKWDVATNPRKLWYFGVYNQEDGNDWQWLLSNALYDEGFPLGLEFMRPVMNNGFFCNVYLPWERENDEQEGTQEETEENNIEESVNVSIQDGVHNELSEETYTE